MQVSVISSCRQCSSCSLDYVHLLGPQNSTHVTLYENLSRKYESNLVNKTITTPVLRSSSVVWTEDDVSLLVESRSQTNPPTFRNIAGELNRLHERMGTDSSRPFNERDCNNKWRALFPSSEDANMTVDYLRKLKKKWTDLRFYPKLHSFDDIVGPPTLVSLHIVWPWSSVIMDSLSSSVFCDATFNVTVYNYKIVCVTTLDGNKQHRPLMCSFILSSSSEQWAVIFDIFHRVVRNHKPEFHVVTSDQEEAIRGGLAMSSLSTMSIHFVCSLHEKWNVRDHK